MKKLRLKEASPEQLSLLVVRCYIPQFAIGAHPPVTPVMDRPAAELSLEEKPGALGSSLSPGSRVKASAQTPVPLLMEQGRRLSVAEAWYL